jgi:hypothetical protein
MRLHVSKDVNPLLDSTPVIWLGEGRGKLGEAGGRASRDRAVSAGPQNGAMTTADPTGPDASTARTDRTARAVPAAPAVAAVPAVPAVPSSSVGATAAAAPHGATPLPLPDPPRPRAVRAARAVLRYLRSAPGTYIWLVILGANTFALVRMSPRFRKYFLITHSTNLVELSHHPVKVLIASALWTETPSFLFWFVLFNLFSVPVERWLGTLRWLGVVALAHILATLVSEGAVAYLIHAGDLPHRTKHTIDIGVSYALSGAVGVLGWRLGRPLRWYYLGAASVFYLLLFGLSFNFTNLGHLTAFLIGVGCYPLTVGVAGGDWRPDRTLLGRLRRFSRFSRFSRSSPTGPSAPAG